MVFHGFFMDFPWFLGGFPGVLAVFERFWVDLRGFLHEI